MLELKNKEVNGTKKTLSFIAIMHGMYLLSETTEGEHLLEDGTTTCYFAASARCLQPKDAEDYFRNW